MDTVRFHQAVAYHEPRWCVAPDSIEADYAAVRAQRWVETYSHNGVTYEVTCRWFPVYAAYAETGTPLREGVPLWFVKNDTSPPDVVVAHQLAELESLARECSVLYWKHCVECFPAVASQLKSMFNFTHFCFDDAAPGSCETKTWPVLHGFDAMIHSMWVRSYQTGELVADEYHKRGLAYTRFAPIGTSAGVPALSGKPGYIDLRAAQHLHGRHEVGLGFVGSDSHDNPARAAFAQVLNARAGELDALGVPTRIHGLRMRDGFLGAYAGMLTEDIGHPVADLYDRTAMSFNFPLASLFNSRFADLSKMGVIQLAHDPWGELAHHGFVDGRHYCKFDGTFDDLKRKAVKLWKSPEKRAEMALAARLRHDMFAAQWPQYPFGDVFADHRKQIEGGR